MSVRRGLRAHVPRSLTWYLPVLYTQSDPTAGFVNYLPASDAGPLLSSNATYFRMSVDTTTPIASGRGRNSIRLESNSLYRDGVFVLDTDHIPSGCGVVRPSVVSRDLKSDHIRLLVASMVDDGDFWLA